MTVESDVAVKLVTTINAAGLGYTVALGKDVRIGPPRPATDNQTLTNAVPHRCVFVFGVKGRNSLAFKDGGQNTGDKYPRVVVWVRSNIEDYGGGKTLADVCQAALDRNPPTGYYESTAGGSPGFEQQDEQRHFEWSFDVELSQQV